MLRSLSSEEAQCGAGDEVTLEVEGVVDGGMSGEEALRRSMRFEALHLPFSPSHHLVRVLRSVVLAQALLMAGSQPELPPGARVGGQPIGHEHRRSIALLAQELAHEPQGCGFVPARLHQHVEDLALAVDRAPEPQPFASDQHSHFGQVFLYVAVAQREAKIEPGRVSDDLGWELMTSIGDGLHAQSYRSLNFL